MNSKNSKKKGRSKGRTAVKVVVVLLVVFVAVLWIIAVVGYNSTVNKRFESYGPLMYRVEDFPGIERIRHTFPSNNGQMLTGYLYRAIKPQDTDEDPGERHPKGLLVLAHGFGGGGHNAYMDVASFFAKNGYDVFAYDATGNDESEGDGLNGFPQGVIDLDFALRYLKEKAGYNHVPIGLFGHSWGAYSVCSVLTYHPDVKAVIAVSGTNSSADIFEVGARQVLGNFAKVLTPFAKLHEQIYFGQYATNTAFDAFEHSNAAVMIVHSADDEIVPIEYGYDTFYRRYKDNPRFSFIRLENAGHSHVLNESTYNDAFEAAFQDWLKTLDYDYAAKENEARFAAEKALYIEENLDRSQWANRLNKDLFDTFLKFYDRNVDTMSDMSFAKQTMN